MVRRRKLAAVGSFALLLVVVVVVLVLVLVPSLLLHPQERKTETSVFFGCLENVLTLQSGGRFGNLFLQFASALGIAQKFHLKLLLPQAVAVALRGAFEDVKVTTLEEYFQGRVGNEGQPCAPRLSENLVLQTPRRWNLYARTPQLHGDGPIVMQMYTMHEEFVAPLAPVLRAELRFRSQLRVRAQAILRALGEKMATDMGVKPHEVVYIGIHVRRTDYPKFLAKQHQFTDLVNESYFLRAVAFLRKELEATTAPRTTAAPNGTRASLLPIAVVVVSDDMTWVNHTLLPAFRNNAQTNATRAFAVGSGLEADSMKDLALLSATNHTVLSYGTFGITAAIMSGGRTVVPFVDRFYYHTMRFAPQFPNWTVLKEDVTESE